MQFDLKIDSESDYKKFNRIVCIVDFSFYKLLLDFLFTEF